VAAGPSRAGGPRATGGGEAGGMEGSLSQLVAIAVTLGLFAAICLILGSRGTRAVVNACLFVTSLVTTQLSVKVLESPPYKYKFPGFLGVLHFSCVSVACAAYWAWAGDLGKFLPSSLGGWPRWRRTVIPIAVSQPISVVLNNKAMVYVGAGVCAIIGTLSPVATALLSRLFGYRLSMVSWCGVLLAFGGGLVISWGEVASFANIGNGEGSSFASVMTGQLFAFASLAGRSIKIVIMDLMLAPTAYSGEQDSNVREEPLPLLHVMALAFPAGAFMSLLYALMTESLSDAWAQLTPATAAVLALTCVSALALNFLGGLVLRDVGASEQQIVGKLNTICIAAISVAFLGERLPAVVLLGTALVLVGVAVFERGTHHKATSDSSSDSDSSGTETESEEDGKVSHAKVPTLAG